MFNSITISKMNVHVNISYKFDELDEEAKQKAIEHFRETEDFQWIMDEATSSLREYAQIFGIRYSTIDPLEPYRNDYRFTHDDNILALSGVRLLKWLWNNHWHDLFQGKYYRVKANTPIRHKRVVSKTFKNGNTHNAYRSAITLENCCVMTGVCYDDDLLDPIYQFMNKPKDSVTLEDLLNSGISSLCKSIQREVEYNQSDEAISEMIEANGYEFTEEGKLF